MWCAQGFSETFEWVQLTLTLEGEGYCVPRSNNLLQPFGLSVEEVESEIIEDFNCRLRNVPKFFFV
jgi:hypothetical protein